MSHEPDAVSHETEAVGQAQLLWPAALDQLERYHHWLVTAGVERGLVGPREVPRMWERHILNSAAIAFAVPDAASVIDVGSGAGLPGLPLAIVRPDLTVTLLEPLARRVDFLNEVVADLGLTERVQVVRARAEEATGLTADVVTGRAVASLAKLLPWCWPLVAPGGQLLPMKGAQAAAEIEEARKTLLKKRLTAELVVLDQVQPPTTLIRIRSQVADLEAK